MLLVQIASTGAAAGTPVRISVTTRAARLQRTSNRCAPAASVKRGFAAARESAERPAAAERLQRRDIDAGADLRMGGSEQRSERREAS